ncbi:hypothetical protein DFJ74DRAFT_271985 [Hyaloraphidium curvatum]|nr:hypothetical protein DFJ74DRAFT_271985 [Hyaloraphidium curvatum]
MANDLLLSPAAQLAVFPSPSAGPPPDVPKWLWHQDAVTAAAAGRAARPLTLHVLREELDRSGKPMGTLVAWDMILRTRLNGRPLLLLPLLEISALLLYSMCFVYGLGLFGVRNLVVALVGFVVVRLAWILPGYGFGIYRVFTSSAEASRSVATDAKAQKDDRRAPAAEEVLYDSSVYAPLVRYSQLLADVLRTTTDTEASGACDAVDSLLEHDDSDDLCPCDGSKCLGHIFSYARSFMLAYVVVHALLSQLTFAVSIWWAPAVTLALAVWGTTWSAVLSGVFIAVLTVFYFVGTFSPGVVNNPSIFALEHRLRHRLLALDLQDLVDRFSRALDSESDLSADVKLGNVEAEPYVGLHGQLIADWRSANAISTAPRRMVVVSFSAAALWAVVCIAVGSCIPAFYLVQMIISLWTLVLQALGSAYKNLQPARTAAQYRSAALSLSALAARIPPDRPRLLAAVRAHRDVLLAFSDLDASKAGFFGVPVTFGTLRAMMVTLVTVAAGLFTVLRATGVYVTMDLACRLS